MFNGMKNRFRMGRPLWISFGTKILIPLIIFLIALLPRVVSLGTVLTADQELWVARSLAFFNALIQHNWAGTFQTTHPGVTTMWLSGISLGLFYTEGMDFAQKLFLAEFPIALMTSIGIVLIYYLVKNIFNIKIAILSAVFMALEPFYIANSRFIHLDAMLTTFMVLSVLSLLAHLNDPDNKHYLFLAGSFTGLAFLTKLPSIFLILFLPFMMIVWYFPRTIRFYETIKKTLLLFVISAVIFLILWPAMWVEPIEIISKPIPEMQYYQTNPHGTGYFMGEISDGNFGLSYYPIMLLMRLTPVTLLFSMIFFIYLITNIKKYGFINMNRNVLILILYIILFSVQMTLSAKKFDRYLLPVFPVIDIIAATGLYYVINSVNENKYLKTKNFKNVMIAFIVVSTLFFQAGSSLSLHPYYLSYYNPTIGGSSHATEIMVFGGGEGMDMAARYLNEKPDAKDLTVAVQYWGFEPYFKGKTVGIDNASISDYIVFYISAVQRDWNKDIWEQYKNEKPEKVIIINNMNYAWIYKIKVGTGK